MRLTHAVFCSLIFAVLGGAVACGGPKAVRGDEVAGLDDQALSTGLDRKDLQKMLQQNMDVLEKSAVVGRWQTENRPSLAVMRIKNETSEHIDSALQSLLSDIETIMVNAGHVRVISQEDQPQLMAELRQQQSDSFDQAQIAQWGKQVGARYFITGKVYSVDERGQDQRRVQYFLFMRVLDAQTGDILWQNKTSVTKALLD
ncbi:MAG TPA: penicillin-binding protein activator LpoB [Polyangiaceae bacterium]|nr:penicillin-binding protein activator LpoB [Polyangiaceae bacterium]